MFRSAFFALLGFVIVVWGLVMIWSGSYRSEPGFNIFRYRPGEGEGTDARRDPPGRVARRRSVRIGLGLAAAGVALLIVWGAQF